MRKHQGQQRQRYTRVLVRAEHVDTALWDRTPGRDNNPIDYDELGLSEELAEELERWRVHFAVTAVKDDGFESQAARDEFTAEGAALAERLQVEVGDDIEVIYVDGFSGIPADPAPVDTGGASGDFHWTAERPG